MSESLRRVYELSLYEKILANRELAVRFSKLENKCKEQLLNLAQQLPEDEIINFKKQIYERIQRLVKMDD